MAVELTKDQRTTVYDDFKQKVISEYSHEELVVMAGLTDPDSSQLRIGLYKDSMSRLTGSTGEAAARTFVPSSPGPGGCR